MNFKEIEKEFETQFKKLKEEKNLKSKRFFDFVFVTFMRRKRKYRGRIFSSMKHVALLNSNFVAGHF